MGGISLEVGDDLLLTAPLFTNPDPALVTLDEAPSDIAAIDALLEPEQVDGAAAILVGHGHHDHLLDVPCIRTLAGDPLIRFDEQEPMFLETGAVLYDVGRVAPAPLPSDHVRVFVMMGCSKDYGRCALSLHDGDSERVVLDLAPLSTGDPGDYAVVGTYTAAHEGTVTDHGLVLGEDELGTATFEADPLSGEPRWVVYASDGKHATYQSIDLCEDAEWAPCLDEDCAPDNVDVPADFDILPPFINAGEEVAPRWTSLSAIGFAGDDAWLDQDFCGGQGPAGPCSSSVLSKFVVDPFE